MAKSKRKHPGINIIEDSPQGRHFLQQVAVLVGGGVNYEAVEELEDKSHVFRITGNRGWGLLVERRGEQDGDTWNSKWGFRLVEPSDADVLVEASLDSVRWDPWLAFGSGEESPVRKATKKQKKEWDLKRAQIGTEGDRLEVVAAPRAASHAPLCGVEDSVLAELEMRHRPEPKEPDQAAAGPVPAAAPTELHQKIQNLLLEMVDRLEIDRDGDFTFPFGSTRLFVRVIPLEKSNVVSISAVTNLDVPPSPELFHFVATNADSWIFGHLSANESKDEKVFVAFSHRLLADFLDGAELFASVSAVASTADQVDEEIQKRFGGRIFESPPATEDVPKPESEPSIGQYL